MCEEGKKQTAVSFKEPTPETIYMFCYTSGTTGDPKGTKMSHSQFVALHHSTEHSDQAYQLDDVSISYLPLAHIFEQGTLIFSLTFGYSLGFYSGDPLKLLDDIKILKPTMFPTVPRILNRVHSKVYEMVKTKTPF